MWQQAMMYHVNKLNKVKKKEDHCKVVKENDGDSKLMLMMSTPTPLSNAETALVLFALLASKNNHPKEAIKLKKW